MNDDFKIRYIHLRRSPLGDSSAWRALAGEAYAAHQIRMHYYGFPFVDRLTAVTICDVEAPYGQKARGWAFCSGRDQFSRAKGRTIARARAMHALGVR